MSLTYKLIQVGSILTKEEILDAIISNSEIEDQAYINVDFSLKDDKISGFKISENAISKNNFMFTVKIGGSGTGMYYMYPNLILKDELLSKKLPQLINSLKSSTYVFANEHNKTICESVIKFIDENIKEIQNEINKYKKGSYVFWFSVNGKTFSELMPEIFGNWYADPVTPEKSAQEGIDCFTGEKTTIGYKPEFKVFSYDNYHNSLSHRIVENVPLSKESATKIKFAWIYILKNLVFYYKGLEYIIIPNIMSDSPEITAKIVKRLRRANIVSKENIVKLKDFVVQEKKLVKDIEKLQKDIDKLQEKCKTDEKKQKEFTELAETLQLISTEVDSLERGLVSELNSNTEHLEDLKNTVVLDFIFTDINRTNLSFVIKGSLEDIIPSRLSDIVSTMKEHNIYDTVKLSKNSKNSTYFKDFFHRNQLLYALTKSSKNNINTILKEQLFLAKLLLTDEKISLDDLMNRFEFNREYNYRQEKRMKNHTKEWLCFPSGFARDERAMLNFFRSIKKIKEQ